MTSASCGSSALLDQPERAAKAAKVAELYASGMTGLQVAATLGLSRSYTYELLKDPDGVETKRRKAKAGGTCIDCGGPTSYGSRDTRLPKRCAECAKRRATETKKWTREAIIDAIRRWVDATGEVPRATCWNATQAAERGGDLAELYLDGDFPSSSTVQLVFGSWNAGVAAAGFTPLEPTGRRGLSDAAYERTAQAYLAGVPISEIAKREAISQNGVRVRLRHLGIYKPRTPTRRDIMGAPLKAEQVIDREIERAEQRARVLREELAEIENTAERLRAARDAMEAPTIKAVA